MAKESAGRVLRANGCSDTYADVLGQAAVDHNINPQLIAGIVFVESTCNANAVSNQGAVGLAQLNIAVWHISKKQALDPEFNIDKGTSILASYIRQYGVVKGLHAYNGFGDPSNQYAKKVLIASYRQ